MLLLILDKDDVDRDYFLRFTIHFATINTKLGYDLKVDGVIFTIHFATINTLFVFFSTSFLPSFTIHFATINTKELELYYDDTS